MSGLPINRGMTRRSVQARATTPTATREHSRPAWKGATMLSSNARGLLAAGIVLLVCGRAHAIEDLRALEVQGQRGQSVEQTGRDRYECHNWAVAQSGETPVAVPDDAEPSDDERERRRERVDRAIVGAAIGAGVGSLL